MASADLVKVVRCKDCKYKYDTYGGMVVGCNYLNISGLSDDDYCSHGAKMDKEETV